MGGNKMHRYVQQNSTKNPIEPGASGSHVLEVYFTPEEIVISKRRDCLAL